MPLRIYNTLTRSLEEFRPLEPGKARVYGCGPFLLLILSLVVLVSKLRTRRGQTVIELTAGEHRQAVEILGKREVDGS